MAKERVRGRSPKSSPSAKQPARGKKSTPASREWRKTLAPYIVPGQGSGDGELKGRCPLHDDRHPSAQFNFRKGVWKCHAGGCGKGGQISSLVRRVKAGKVVHSGRPPSAEDPRKGQPDPLPTEEEIASWVAALADTPGRPAYLRDDRLIDERVLTDHEIGWDPKNRAYTIPLRDGSGDLINVKWYRPATTARDKKQWVVRDRPTAILWPEDQLRSPYIVLCEGEWDALALISKEIPAVTTAAGAGEGKWRHEMSRSFSGKRVGLVMDSDAAGRTYAEEVAESVAVYASLVRRLDLDENRDDGYDVTDFFRDGHSAQDLLNRLKTAPVQSPHRLSVVSAWDRLERLRSEPPPRWRVRGIWLAGTYGVLAGPSKAGKSWDIAAMVVAAASGKPLWGSLPVDVPTHALYFVGEDDEWLTLQRLEAICRWQGSDPREILSRIHVAEAVPRFGEERDLDVVRQQFERHPEARFTAIEPLYLTVPGAEGRQLFDMAGLLGAIQQVVVNEAGADLLIGHHWNQAGKGTGASRMAGAGPEEWGRVLMSGSPTPEVGLPDFFIKREMTYEISGTRIPSTTLLVERAIRQEDSEDPGSPYHYRATASFQRGPRRQLSPAEEHTLAALSATDPLTVAQVAEKVNEDREEPYDTETIRKALKRLEELSMATHEGKRNTTWRRTVVEQVPSA